MREDSLSLFRLFGLDLVLHVIKGTLSAPPGDANPPNADFPHRTRVACGDVPIRWDMLFLLKPWTFDPGQLSGFRPTADVLVLVTVAFFMGLIVSVRLVRFLWVLQRHTEVARGMVWMCSGLIVLNVCRAIRLGTVWRDTLVQ